MLEQEETERAEQPAAPSEATPAPEEEPPKERQRDLLDRLLARSPEPEPAPAPAPPDVSDEVNLRRLAARLGRSGEGGGPDVERYDPVTGAPQYRRGDADGDV